MRLGNLGHVRLVFGDERGDHLSFELGSVEHGFVLGSVVLTRQGDPDVRLTDRNGIEALALANLRLDVGSLREQGRGAASFGDHDFGSMVLLRANGNGLVEVTVNLASEDLWDVALPEMAMAELDELSAVISAAERAFGPLVGYCGACGAPAPTFEPLTP